MTASQSSIEIGRRLTVAKATLPHGQFIPWVTATFGFGPTMTQCSTASTSSPTTSRARVRVDLLGEVERPLARRKLDAGQELTSATTTVTGPKAGFAWTTARYWREVESAPSGSPIKATPASPARAAMTIETKLLYFIWRALILCCSTGKSSRCHRVNPAMDRFAVRARSFTIA
jgi:hypothetical protein